jgi:hypothetical protein
MKNDKTLAFHRANYDAAVRADKQAWQALDKAEREWMDAAKEDRPSLARKIPKLERGSEKACSDLERAELVLLRYLLAAAPTGLAKDVIEIYRSHR